MSTIYSQTTTSTDVDPKLVNRREFLNYFWGASIALLLAESGGAALWFALPHREYGAKGGLFVLKPDTLPQPGSDPIGFPVGRFWLSNTNKGLLALDMFCTVSNWAPHLFKWVPTNDRFECPACGSKYKQDGTFIRGTEHVWRDLDRFVIEVTTPGRTRRTPPDGSPVDIQDATSVLVDINHKILGKPTQPY